MCVCVCVCVKGNILALIIYCMLCCSVSFFVGERGSECISVMWYCVLLICVLYEGLKKISSCVCSGRISIDVSFNIRFLPYKEQTGRLFVHCFQLLA
jgi:hypothetical protein